VRLADEAAAVNDVGGAVDHRLKEFEVVVGVVLQVGVAYYGRSYEEGKKITWKDGVKAILTIIRFRFWD
jgi:hypothetical protein